MNDNLRGEASHDRQKSDKITDMKDHFYINKNDSGCPLYWADDVAYNNDVVWQCKYRADAKREGKKVPIERRTIVLLYTKKTEMCWMHIWEMNSSMANPTVSKWRLKKG
jgi:hypothetical protein